jgi:hypothetical protein
VNCSLCLFGYQFCLGRFNLPTSCNVPSRTGNVSDSPGGVADSLLWNWVSSHKVQVGSSPRFCFHALWWAQDVPGACSTCSAVLCVAIFAFPNQERKLERKKKREKQLSSVLTNSSAGPSLLWDHPAILRVSH